MTALPMNSYQVVFAVLAILMAGAVIAAKATSIFMKILSLILIFGLIALIILSS